MKRQQTIKMSEFEEYVRRMDSEVSKLKADNAGLQRDLDEMHRRYIAVETAGENTKNLLRQAEMDNAALRANNAMLEDAGDELTRSLDKSIEDHPIAYCPGCGTVLNATLEKREPKCPECDRAITWAVMDIY